MRRRCNAWPMRGAPEATDARSSSRSWCIGRLAGASFRARLRLGWGIAVAGVCDRGLSQHQSSLGFGVLRAAAQLGEGGKSRRVIRVAGEGITVVADGLV